MKLVVVIVSLVTALASCYTQAQQIYSGSKPYRYSNEAQKLLDDPGIRNAAFINGADDYISLTEAKQVLNEARDILNQPEIQNSALANEADDYIYLTKAQQVSNGRGGYSYIDEDTQIINERLVVADGPKNPTIPENDDMAMLLGRSRWCRSRDGQCRRGKFSCPDKYQESPYGRPYCTGKKRRCCYPVHLATCSKIWCESANEECDDNNGTTVGSCQCADGYVRDKKRNCIGTCSVILCDKANEECDDNAGTTAGSCQCADGYVRDKQNNCVGTCSVTWCDKANEQCNDNNRTTVGSCQCTDGYVRNKRNKCVGTCSVIWCDKANEECDDNNGTTAGSCQCADGYVRDKRNNCVGTCSVIWCDKANEECDDNNGTTAGSCQCADGYFRDKQNNCVGTCSVIWCDKANEECDDNNGTAVGSCQCADGYVRDKQNNCIGTCSVIWCDKANEECDDNNRTTAGSCQCADGYVRDKENNCIGTCRVIWCDKANEECDDNNGKIAGSCQCTDGYVRDKRNNCIVTTTTSVPTTTATSTTRSPSAIPIADCGGEFTSSNGTIRYPSSGGNYQNNENCTWIIMAPVSFNIKFMSFDTESNYDYLYVRNGESMKGSFTGSNVPSPVAITTNNASLHFTSDGSQTRTGFEIQWEPTASCPEGFFRAGNSQQCFLFLMDIQRNWTDAREKCEDEGYSLAEPQDPLALKSYLVDTYEPEWSIWIGAQGDGSSLRWLRSGEVISESDPLWYQNEPGTKVTPDHNIMLILSQFTNTPFISYPGRLTRNTLCELVPN